MLPAFPRWVVAVLALFVAAAVAAPFPAESKDCCPCKTTRRRRARSTAHVPRASKLPAGVASLPITGGRSASMAVTIEPGKIYKINQPLKKGQKTYFVLPLEPGVELTLAMKSLRKADVTADIADPRDRTVASLAIAGEVNEAKRATWKPMVTGRYVIAVGASGGGVGKGNIIFRAETAPSPVVCAEPTDEPLILSPDTPMEDCFWKDDKADRFRFQGFKRDVYRIEIATTEPTAAGLRAKVGLEQKKKGPKNMMDVSGSGGKVAVESVVLPKKGTYLLEVELLEAASDVLPYKITFTRTSGPASSSGESRPPRRHRHVDRPYY